MNRNTTATVGQAQRVNQTDGKCIRHTQTSSNPGGNGSRRTDSLATIPAARSAQRSEGIDNQPPSRPENINQPGRRGGRRLVHLIREIRRQALNVSGYAVRYPYSKREKRWNVFVRLDRET